MANEVKWIKISSGIFEDDAFQLIDAMPEADAIELIWFKLLVFAGASNNQGVFLFKDKVAYTDEMLAAVFHRPLNTVRLALKTFEEMGMIEQINNVYSIPNWSKYQTLDAYEKKKERDKLYSAQRRAKVKALVEQKGLYSEEDFLAVCNYFDNRCAYCGSKTKLTPDHVIAINNNGSTNIENILPCCEKCNSSKGVKDMETWYKTQAFFKQERLDFINEYLESQNSRSTVERDCSYSYSNSISKDINKTNIKNKTNKSINKDIRYFEDDDLNNTFADFVEMRKATKEPMTDRAIKIAKKKINEYAKGNKQVAIAVIEQSILNNWKGIFPLKDNSVIPANPQQTKKFTKADEEALDRLIMGDKQNG